MNGAFDTAVDLASVQLALPKRTIDITRLLHCTGQHEGVPEVEHPMPS